MLDRECLPAPEDGVPAHVRLPSVKVQSLDLNESKVKTSDYINDVEIDFIFANTPELDKSATYTRKNTIFNDAGKLMLNVNGEQPGNGPGGYGIQAPPSFRDPASTVGDTDGTYGGGTAPTPGGFWFGGGGGASASPYNTFAGTGGSGGGASGFGSPNSNDIPVSTIGKENTGGGGGGYALANPYRVNSGHANGGSGIVLIAYPT